MSGAAKLYKEAAKKFIEQNQYPKSFSSKLISHIFEKNKENNKEKASVLFRDIYKQAGISRQVFYKIKNNINYNPKKSTAISLCFALKLNLYETRELLGLAGYDLSYWNKNDLLIMFCIEKEIYDVYLVNEILYTFNQKTITIHQ